MEVKGTAIGPDSVAVSGLATGDRSTGVVGQADGFGVRGEGSRGHGVVGFSKDGFGVYGKGLTGGTGVVGESSRWHAVGGFSASQIGGCGLYGRHTAGGTGIAGETNGPAAAVYGRNTEPSAIGTAGGTGVLGHSDRGVGVWGSVIHDGGMAGFFKGNVSVHGIFTKAAGSFKIDHPLDPANKCLSHSFVESPDMMNVYNGTALLGGDGRATIQLPDYFEVLNRDFRYQLTPIGAPAPNLHVAEEVKGGRFEIAGGSPGQKVSWQVTGIRQDVFAQAFRIRVEEEKPPNERGTYLMPKLFGQPESRAVDFQRMSELLSTDLSKQVPQCGRSD